METNIASGGIMTVAAANEAIHGAPRAIAPAAENAERLTPFQQLMLQWEALHPYNAVHAAVLRGRIDAAALHESIAAVCRESGIGLMRVDRRSMGLRYDTRGAPVVGHTSALGSIEEAVRRIADEQINAPFPEGPQHPIRWFTVECGPKIALVAAYRHVAADASGMAALMACVIGRRAGGELRSAGRMTTTPPAEIRAAHVPTSIGAVSNVARTIALYFRLRHSHKMPDEKLGGDRTTCVHRAAAPGLAERLRAACARRGVGLNDVALAALGCAIASRTTDRHVSRKRRAIALASAVSVRRRLGEAAGGYFGTLLGDMLVRLPNPDAAFEEVMRDVAHQTRTQRDADWKSAMRAAAARVFCVRTIWPLFRVPNDRRSYRKLFPVCGGVSTFAVTGERMRDMVGEVESYIRYCPPGPAMPLVLAPTVMGDRMEISLVFREACMEEGAGADLLKEVVDRLGTFAEAER